MFIMEEDISQIKRFYMQWSKYVCAYVQNDHVIIVIIFIAVVFDVKNYTDRKRTITFAERFLYKLNGSLFAHSIMIHA